MSSRAASSRKRINKGEEAKEKKPASKGFFSRSKNSAKDKPVIDPSPLSFHVPKVDEQPVIGSVTNTNPPPNSKEISQHRSPSPSHGVSSEGSYTAWRTPVSKSTAPIQSSGNRMGGMDSGYPSPPHEVQYQSHIIRLSANGRGHQTPDYQGGTSYIEASYQPPPPVIATYQPQPPSSGPSRLTGRPLPIVPGEGTHPLPSKHDALAYSMPPIFPPLASPVPSPHRASLRQSSIAASSSRSQSPTPSYHSTLLVPAAKPPLQVSIDNSHLLSHSSVEISGISAYPSPPSPNPLRNTPPLRIFRQNPDDSPSLPAEMEKRQWYGGGPGSNRSIPSSPVMLAVQSSPIPTGSLSPRLPPPPSLSESSDSGKSLESSEAKPVFIYPGSRSVAKPKVSKKKSNTVVAINAKPGARTANDAARSSNPGAQISPPISPDRGLHTPISPPTSGSLLPIVSTPTKRTSGSSSTFSNDSEDESHGHRKPASASGKPTQSTDRSGTPTTYVFPTSRSCARPSGKSPFLNRKGRSDGKGVNNGERKRFMKILLSKKKSSEPTAYSSGESNPRSSASDPNARETNYPNSHLPNTGSNLSDATLAYEESRAPIQQDSRERAMKIKSRIGSYPLDPYDSVLLDNDRHTGELLSRLNSTGSPTFHNYGNSPPVSVLDLGCGQGHWVIDAAIAWKGYGTKVTGYDMVDISRGLFPWAAQQGVVNNIRFVRGNFVKQRLPFNDESFDLVRMSGLGLCVTTDSWVFVLQEINRVLMPGGRLEMIDDEIFFPYGRNSTLPRFNQRYSIAPQLDIAIPSSSFTTYSIYDGETTNPGLGVSFEEAEATEFYELYGVDEEAETEVDDDTATVHGFNMGSSDVSVSSNPRNIAGNHAALGYHGISSRSWMRAHDTSKDIEALFDHMLVHKFGISTRPNEFILDVLQEVFGHAREVSTMHIALAPTDRVLEDDRRGRQPGSNSAERMGHSIYNQQNRSRSSSRRYPIGLSQSSGLILWPSTFIPMSQPEIEIHASKHLRMLLSCKNYLIEHAIEATDDEDIDEESVLEALWEYEGFLRHRFNSPPPASASTSEYSHHRNDSLSDSISIAESVTTDSIEAMLEIQSEFRQHFGWQRSPSRDPPDSPGTVQSQDDVVLDPDLQSRVTSSLNAPSQSPLSTRDVLNNLSSDDLTHVRTFRIYEAIKVDEGLFSSAAF